MHFIFIEKDKSGMATTRHAVRTTRRAYIYGGPAEARLVYGAPLADDSGEMSRSLLLIESETKTADEAFVAGNPYNQTGLFEDKSLQALHEVAPEPQMRIKANE